MSKVRVAMWSVSIGVMALILAALAFRAIRGPGMLFAGLLVVSVALVSALVALVIELPPRAGAGGGAFAAILVLAVLGLTIAAAPLGPGAQRPGFSDLIGLPGLAVLAAVLVASAAGWAGARLGLYVVRRRRGSGPVSGPTA